MPWMLSCSVSRTTFLVDRRLSCLALLCSLMCALPAHRRTTLPVPVVRNRFAADCARQGQGVRCDAATRATRGASARAGAGVRRRSDSVGECSRVRVSQYTPSPLAPCWSSRGDHATQGRCARGTVAERRARRSTRRGATGWVPGRRSSSIRGVCRCTQGGGGVWRVGWDGRPRGTSRVLLSITSARAARRLATAGRRHAAPLLRGGRVCSCPCRPPPTACHPPSSQGTSARPGEPAHARLVPKSCVVSGALGRGPWGGAYIDMRLGTP